MTAFKKAEKSKSKLRLALVGVSGSGKTYSALAIASHLGQKVAFIDTEHGSAALYADLFNFDVLELAPPFSPERFVAAIKAAEGEKYDVVIIDSLSHAWAGEGGLLDKQAALEKSGKYKNSFTSWRDITPQHNQLVDSLLRSSAHIIVCMRAKAEYVVESNEKGKSVPRKIGLAPVQRDGLEFEFTTVLDVSGGGYATASKDRTRIFSQTEAVLLGENTGDALLKWLETGKELEPEYEIKPEDLSALFTDIEEVTRVEDLTALKLKQKKLIAAVKERQPALYPEIVTAFKDRAEAIRNPEPEEMERTND